MIRLRRSVDETKGGRTMRRRDTNMVIWLGRSVDDETKGRFGRIVLSTRRRKEGR